MESSATCRPWQSQVVGLADAVKARHPDVDWPGLAGFRNVLVHDYLGVDLELVYRAVEHDVPRLKQACESAIAETDDQK